MEVYGLVSSSGYDAATYSAEIETNYEDFLTLLTTQIQNQDPTNPMDTTDLTNQLGEYYTLEQQVMTNELLNTLVLETQYGSTGNPTEYLGNTVTYVSDEASLGSDGAYWEFDLPEGTTSADLTVTDSEGNTVYEATASYNNDGINNFIWNGAGTDGNTYTSGTYTLQVIASDANGTVTDVDDIYTQGTVSKVNWVSGEYVLTVDDETITSNKVTAIATAA
ncbi:flagellar hook assembly protein FlgD [Curvivirga aplysinae]|uniref:flagellar hook assembly protein FlgD n=1 Tax=Curvivirga aplysinae TaxID=2529852 RepID=UPI0012BCEABE|nr:flagellar hook capping FlgD N-terminal domain-containing protein [Curvivirga aplysinae]MTI09724.1 flagellar biosynthesis protein FlgD [Curvivirga aplysinae]